MICPKCKIGKLKITHTRLSSPGIKTQRSRCGHCKRVFTIVCRAEFCLPERGQGACALARKWKTQAERSSQTEETSPGSTESDSE